MFGISKIDAFKKEILLILLVKLVLIYGIWLVFFSRPIDKHLTGDDVGRYLLGPSDDRRPSALPQK
ncbi:MAG: cytochrome oxidase putative small subunit CydP [Gammaproteobacteria bacterium]